jgi:hypothetical protein
VRLKQTNVKEFKGSHEIVNDYFRKIGKLLHLSKKTDDKMYRAAYKMFNFHEVNGIGLGYATGEYGNAFGKVLRKRIIEDAKIIIDHGVRDPEIFHLVGLFEENVGPDRLSDMLACILKDEIITYTKRINKELNITKEEYPQYEFEDGLLINPFKKHNIPVLLLPQSILHELPIAKDWEDIDRVCREIAELKEAINQIVGEDWRKMALSEKKKVMKEKLMEDPELFSIVIEEYRKYELDEYDFENDPNGDYLMNKVANEMPYSFPLKFDSKPRDSFTIAEMICNKFKDQIENNRVWDLLYFEGKHRKEAVAQRLFFVVADSYCHAHNLDISPEADGGRGPVDFKMSNGYDDRTVVEMKLTTNPNIVHGFETQIGEYAKAENTNKAIYLVVDNEGSRPKLQAVKDLYYEHKDEPNCPLLIIVDGRPKASASKYKGHS